MGPDQTAAHGGIYSSENTLGMEKPSQSGDSWYVCDPTKGPQKYIRRRGLPLIDTGV
jgi:hypothetical protein